MTARSALGSRLGREGGVTLTELLIATAIGALLLAGLTTVAREGVMSRAHERGNGEAAYQARFALQRMVAAARTTAPHALLPPSANTSGNWFDPTYFCVNGALALIETTTTDTGCTGTRVIAEQVSALSATQPAGAGALEAITAVIAITIDVPGATPVVLSERLRFGGGIE